MSKENLTRIMRWYMITVITGKEEKVLESLKNRIISENMEELFEDFKAMWVPKLSKTEMEKKVNGEPHKTPTNINLFPGYMFIKMDMTNEAWFLVRNTQYVTGLVGSSGQRTKPTPISTMEMKKMEKKVQSIKDDFDKGKQREVKSKFEVGNRVEIIDGPSKGMQGKIVENNDSKAYAIVDLILFERVTPTQVEHSILKVIN